MFVIEKIFATYMLTKGLLLSIYDINVSFGF